MNKGLLLISCFLCALLQSTGSKAEPILRYQLELSEQPTKAQLSIQTKQLGAFQLSAARSMKSEISTPADLLCLRQGKTNKATLDTDLMCDEVRWSVNFIELKQQDYDVSQQQNLYSEQGWWLLTEWDDLLRVKGADIAELCLKKKGQLSDCKSIPAMNQPPLFYLTGKSLSSIKIAGQQFDIYSNTDISTLLEPSQLKLQQAQFDYLMQLTAAKPSQAISLLWLGVSPAQRNLGGAAGLNSYLANFHYDASGISAKSQQRLWWISGHELFHMLYSKPLPLWQSESLAHYFGYKSLLNAGVQPEQTPLYYAERAASGPNATAGLYLAQQKVTEQQDYSYYALFYDKGAAFWYELDQLIQQQGKSLELYLPLLHQQQPESDQLPAGFIDSVSRLVGKRSFEQLQQRYLTAAPSP
ncbi:hypothetical protein EMM73_17735 [Rheinheimera sediminis]|uniref:hypothetical protein n=1 Tax=Rheinheimera sp. YQF-1 TaxID=2499626 RepID=UPI000FD74415|nr:hypothetical protein [Rheinheimera sp. YQF-1]RVT43043.1 hypothetical protein EMM73_17735 [Rheinheimera sp. YQF-1]